MPGHARCKGGAAEHEAAFSAGFSWPQGTYQRANMLRGKRYASLPFIFILTADADNAVPNEAHGSTVIECAEPGANGAAPHGPHSHSTGTTSGVSLFKTNSMLRTSPSVAFASRRLSRPAWTAMVSTAATPRPTSTRVPRPPHPDGRAHAHTKAARHVA